MTRHRLLTALALTVLLAGCVTSPRTAAPTDRARAPSATPSATADRSRDTAALERLVQPTPLPRAAQPAMAAAFRGALVADHCVDRDLPAPAADDPALTLLDRTYALSADYVPGDLVSASVAGLDGPSGMRLVREAIIADLAAMTSAWRAAGLTIEIESAYRSHAAQAATYQSWVARIGAVAAAERTARPGHSEHQLGTAIDVTSPGWSGRFGDWATESAEGAWMAEHAWQYGFVMSYPAGSRDRTCYGYEPWHYRWIGREAAAAQRDSGLPLRQFLERYVRG